MRAIRVSLLLAAMCAAVLPAQPRFEALQRDLERLRAELHVPGMAAAVVRSGRVVWRSDFGLADVSRHVPVTPATQFPIASVTKTMAAVLLMQLVEQGRLSLDDEAAPGMTIRRALSHTADGTPGEEFLYNSANFNKLTAVIEKAAGSTFAEQLRTRIFAIAGMQHTSTSLLRAPHAAKPYLLDHGVTKPGTYPRGGVSAATGVISTTADLARYAIALDGTQLASSKSKDLMFTPTRSTRGEPLPYGLGWFTQTYLGEGVVWHYGQESAFSSLFLRVPEKKLTFIVLANSSTLSDAGRLLDGNVARSLAALAFFRDVVFSGRDSPELMRDELVDESLAQLYLGHREQSAATLRTALEKFLALPGTGELTLLGLLAQLQFPETEACATVLLKEHPNLPPAWYYYGTFLEKSERYRESAACFEQITQHQPPWHHWTVSAAREELKKLQ